MADQPLWAPWRIGYVRSLLPGSDRKHSSDAGEGCFFCTAFETDLTAVAGPADAEPVAEEPTPGWSTAAPSDAALVLVRDERGLLMLNRYPYTNGHLLVAPWPHVHGLGDLSSDQRTGLMELANLGMQLLEGGLNAQGANIGMNLGQCAGAGLPGHLHMHLVPRWHGDVNFMDVTGAVRVIPEALAETAAKLRRTRETIE